MINLRANASLYSMHGVAAHKLASDIIIPIFAERIRSPLAAMTQSNNRDISVALAFHEATKHSYTSVRSGAHSLDWSNRPLPYKIYPGAGTLALPRDLSLPPTSTLSALRQRQDSPQKPFDLEAVTRLLFCAGGLTKRASVGGEDYHFRAAASAGALYPVEIYLVAGEIEGMERGLYHFLPADLKLHGLRRGDWRPYLARCAGSTSICDARAVFILTSIFWRSAWKYRARAYRYCFWDAGMIVANLLAAANADALNSEIVTTFSDQPLEELLEVDGGREGIACLVAVGHADAAPEESPVLSITGLESIALSAKELVYEDLVRLQNASRLSTSQEVSELNRAQFESRQLEASSAAITLDGLDDGAGAGLGETILRRGSTRVFAHKPIAAEELATILATSNFAANRPLAGIVETYLIVNGVLGIAPGVYYYHRESGALEPLKAGDFRAEAGYLCLEQPLGADCSALIIYMADLERALRSFGNRGYRIAHLEAGLLGGRVYLVAYSLARGATGLTYYDDDTTSFLRPHCEELSPLLMIAVGVPRSDRQDI
jgi:SagB-type dehydrogenase family enzyme